MDPSALIFIALAVAWALYLIPKALEHHEESVRTRTVEKFSATLRVLARREPVSRRRARLVSSKAPRRQAAGSVPAAGSSAAPTIASRPVPLQVRRTAAARAARRRLRVVSAILLAVVAVAALALSQAIPWLWVAVPVGVLAIWLVGCRVMVTRERRAARPARQRTPQGARTAAPEARRTRDAPKPADPTDAESTGEISAVATVAAPGSGAGLGEGRPNPTDPDSWDPVPVTLPTYVSKPVAQRSVRTIDLDSTGVWTSGRTESDSELVRESQARESERREATDRASRRRRA